MQTAELWVALKYSQGGDSSVLLWLRTQNFMDRDVDLTWISAFPHERGFLYSLLTYITLTAHIGNKLGTHTLYIPP